MPQPVVRSYQEGDEAAIVELFHRRFHTDRTAAHWQWKFRRHPWGPGIVSLAFEGDDLIAHTGGYPMRLLVHGAGAGVETINCLHIGDVMATRRAMRGGLTGGAFAATLHHLHEQVPDRDMAFTYGAAAPGIERFYRRVMHRRLVEEVVCRRLRPARLTARRRIGRARRSPYEVEIVARPGEEFDALLAAAGPGYGVLSQRDAAYVSWRYGECPDRVHRVYAARCEGQLVGWAAFRHAGTRLEWGDALIDPRHAGAGSALLQCALDDHRGERIDTVEAWFPQRPAWWHEALEDIGFTSLVEPRQLRLIYRCMTARDDERSIIDRVYYTMGDTDLF